MQFTQSQRAGLIASIFCCVSLIACQKAMAGSAPKPPPVSAFSRFAGFEDVTISPLGDYVAARVHFTNGIGLAVIRLSDSKVVAHVEMGESRDLARYWWVGPNRLVLAPALHYGALEAPGLTGELIGVDADGANQAYLFGYRAASSIGTAIRQVQKAKGWATIINPLPDDPHHAIIEVNSWFGDTDSVITESHKLNVDNGLLSDRLGAPATGYTDFLADWNGVVRYAQAQGPDLMSVLTFQRSPESSDWTPINQGSLKNALVLPLRFSKDNARVYLSSDEGGDRLCLVEQTLATGSREKLSCDDTADLDHAIFSFDGKEAIAAVYLNDKPRIVPLKTDNPDAVTLQRLELSFPGEVVEPVSHTTDGSKLVLYVYSDRDPGGWYLFDTKAMQASPIVAAREDILPEQMAERRPIVFKARDGQELHGYLTIPPGVPLKNLPMVVNPHGGPIDVADTWGWDPDAELLATRGYAVLQINYRGSRGFGSNFKNAGKKAWDSVMINDLTDGVRWAVQQGFADPKRLCIYGVSYGGYAALMSAVKEPDLYRCAIGYSGVYDLNLLAKDSDTTDSDRGRNYFKEFIGTSPETLAKASPITYVDKLKASVLIVHGKDDERAPFEQATALRKALDLRHYPYEWMAKKGEGHGFYNEDNRAEFYQKLLDFLDHNIGAGAPKS